MSKIRTQSVYVYKYVNKKCIYLLMYYLLYINMFVCVCIDIHVNILATHIYSNLFYSIYCIKKH